MAHPTSKNVFPILNDIEVDTCPSKHEEVKNTLFKWLEEFKRDETKDHFYYETKDKIYLITIRYLFDGKHARGYQFFITDDTDSRKYMKLLANYNSQLSEEVTAKTEDIVQMLNLHGIAIFDTARAVRRLSGNASDKDLEIVEKTDIPSLLSQIPLCHDIVCTGQKSFSVFTEDYGAPVPAMGKSVELTISGRSLRLWRMPSSSRAYPMPLIEKASYYRTLMQQVGCMM